MSWNYRVYKKRHAGYGDCEYTLREDYQDIGLYTAEPQAAGVFEDDEKKALEMLRWQLEMMLKALDKPVLDDDKE
jgi:hypothetical protein